MRGVNVFVEEKYKVNSEGVNICVEEKYKVNSEGCKCFC